MLKAIIKKIARNLPDRQYIQLDFLRRMGKFPNLKKPKTYNEKLQWLKLYDRKPEYTNLVDKYEVRKYIARTIGESYLVPLVGGPWNSVDEINFDELPEKFVLKCTHDSGGLVICTDKSRLDRDQVRKKLSKCLAHDYYKAGREWPYKNVKPRIIAEKYMEDSQTKELRDYKFFAFNGEVKLLFIATDRQNPDTETKFDFFDMDFNHIDVRNGHPNAEVLPEKPGQFEQMRRLAEKLSVGIPHVRVDFYEVDGQVYFGELTFYHWSGMTPFDPPSWDRIMGDWIELPEKTEG